jgi:nitroreductase
MNPEEFSSLLAAHRSVRSFEPRNVDQHLLDQVLEEALQGSSSSGNLNMVSVIKTLDIQRKEHLYQLHGQQPMVLEAPCVMTFCADSFRTRQWLAQRGARPGFADLVSWHVASFDAMIIAQTAALGFESHGLGICYMGTTLFAMREIADYLELPENCLPVTSLVVGWPAERPPQRDRLPPAAWIHSERYHRPSADDIETLFAGRDKRGKERYMAFGEDMKKLWVEHSIETLAQYYTSKIKYDPDLFAEFSVNIEELLRERGFLAAS